LSVAGIRGVALISVGTLAGQSLVLVSTPLLARLYTPQDMGHLSVFVSLVGIVSTTASLHYELAIPLPKSARGASTVSALAILVLILMCCAMTIVLSINDGALLDLVGAADLRESRYWLPIALLLTGAGTVLTLNTVRYHTYGRNAASKIMQGGVQAASQAAAGLFGAGWLGLIVGQILGMVGGIVPLVSRTLWIQHASTMRGLYLRMTILMRRYRNFPLLAAPSSLVNAGASNIPPLLIASFFGLKAAGLYGLGFRMLQLPTRFVGQAVSQVFLGQAAQGLRENRLASLVDQAYRVLAAAALHVFIPIVILARPAFSVAFGAVWEEAGVYVQCLMPWVMLGFVSTPLSMLVTVLQKQRQELLFQCGYLALIVASLAGGAILDNPRTALLIFGITGAAYLGAKVWWLLGIAGCRRGPLLAMTGRELVIAAAANVPLVLLSWLSSSALLTCVLGACWATAIQIVNLRVRRVYAF